MREDKLQEGENYKYEVKVRGQIIGSVVNKVAREFTDVKVFVGDNWYNAAPGHLRGLTIIPDIQVSEEKGKR